MRGHRIVLLCLLALLFSACDSCGGDDGEGETTEQTAEPESQVEEQPKLPESQKLAFTLQGGVLDGKQVSIDVDDSVGYWLFDPRGKNTMIAARGQAHGYDIYFYAALPMKETGTYEFRAGPSGADTRVQLRIRKQGEEEAFAYLANEGQMVLAEQTQDWLQGTFSGKFIRSEKMGADLKDMKEEDRKFVTIEDGSFAVSWKDRLGGKAARWEEAATPAPAPTAPEGAGAEGAAGK